MVIISMVITSQSCTLIYAWAFYEYFEVTHHVFTDSINAWFVGDGIDF